MLPIARWKRHSIDRPIGDQHVPADVEHVAEVRVGVDVEHVLVHAPRHVPGDEQELAEHDQDPRRAALGQVPREPQRDGHHPAEADVPVDVGRDRDLPMRKNGTINNMPTTPIFTARDCWLIQLTGSSSAPIDDLLELP